MPREEKKKERGGAYFLEPYPNVSRKGLKGSKQGGSFLVPLGTGLCSSFKLVRVQGDLASV